VALPSITVNSGSICSGNSFTMVPSGAVSYTFSGGSAVVSPTTNATYSVTGTGTQGCVSAPKISTVTVNPRPTITVNSGTFCSGSNFTIVPSGAFTYTVSGGSFVVSPVINTSYTVTGTSTAGCTSTAPAVSTVTLLVAPTVTASSGAICPGQSFVIVAGGANSYLFSSGTATVSPLSTTIYTVTGTNTIGCSGQALSTVSVNPQPTITIFGGAGLFCIGETLTLSALGAVSYSWSTGNNGFQEVVTPIITTNYTVTGPNIYGCTDVAVVTVSVGNCIGVDEYTSDDGKILVYPNPFKDKITLVLNGGRQRISILNALGTTVSESIIEKERIEMDLSHLPPGIYFIRMEGVSKKIIRE
jgi:hypothetical protein